MPGLVERMAARINAEPQPRAVKLWTATYLLMGLRYSEELVSQLLEGVHNMQESTTYQAILREGLNKGLKKAVKKAASAGSEQQLSGSSWEPSDSGNPSAAILAAIEAIRDVERLEALGERIVDPDVRDWDSLLGAP